MFELAGISKFLDIFQKSFGLIEKHRESKRLLLDEVVEPIYTELSAIVGEYYNFFRGCRDAFTEADFANFEEILMERRRAREEIVLARNKVLGITDAFINAYGDGLKKKKSYQEIDSLLYGFARNIRGFFFASDDCGETRASSLFQSIERYLKTGNTDFKASIINSINESLQNMEWKWRKISEAYGELRVYCLSR